jgi:hypothetical protein
VPSGQLELPLPDPSSKSREDELLAAALQRLRTRWGWAWRLQEVTLRSCTAETKGNGPSILLLTGHLVY